MPAGALRVEGLRELNRAFAVADRSLKRELTEALRDVGEPVRADAERLAATSIPRVGIAWSRMRVGITTTTVYVAPRSRRRAGTRRPNLAGLLLDRALTPALTANVGEVERRFGKMLDTVGKDWERA
jgi:hypothetical protein